VPALLFAPRTPRADAPVVVHVGEEGKPRALEPATLPVRLARNGFRVLAIDVRDTGEGALCVSPRFPVRWEGKLTAYDPDLWRREMLAIRALGVGRSRSGLRVLDILRAGDLLDERGLLGAGYAIVGEGRLGIEALKAAALDARAAAAIAVRTLVSYRMITDHPYYNQDQHVWTPGALKDYDIPDLPILIAPRPVAFIGPVDHMTQPVGLSELRRRFRGARVAYATAGQADGLVLALARGRPSVGRKVVEVLGRGEP
jgi:hypothetical protein